MVEEYSRFVTVRPIKAKSDATKEVIKFVDLI